MVRRYWFHPEVRIVMGRERHNVNSLDVAAEILMSDNWPVYGPACEQAAEMLINALLGKATGDEVRDALRDAAAEAGILVH